MPMTTLWNICAWTGLIWWGCLAIALPWIVLMTFGRDEYGELFIEDPDQ
jgi:hypothetical protein